MFVVLGVKHRVLHQASFILLGYTLSLKAKIDPPPFWKQWVFNLWVTIPLGAAYQTPFK